jgi:hypothetical protein
MNIFDIRTVFISYSISNAICAAVMAFLWLQNRGRFPELGFWLANFIMEFMAVLLVTLRGIVPDFISIVIANTVGVAGIILLYMGLERFVNKVSSQRHNYILLAAFFVIHTYYTYFQPSLIARNHNFSLAILVVCIQGAWLTIYRVDPQFRPRTSRIGLIFIAFGLVSFLRIFLDLSLPTTNDLFQSGLVEALVILVYQMLYISLSFTLFLLVNQRLVDELERDIVARAQMEMSLQQRLMELETVNMLSISLRAGKNLQELLHILLKEALKAVTASDGCILLLNSGDSDTLHLAESRAGSGHCLNFPLRLPKVWWATFLLQVSPIFPSIYKMTYWFQAKLVNLSRSN